MNKQHLATSEVSVEAPAGKVWDALTHPELIEKYMMGAKVSSDWKEGSEIRWKGEFKGKPYEDKGKILALKPGKTFTYTHFSPMAGKPDAPENYHTVSINLTEKEKSTLVSLTQDNNGSENEKQESEKTWGMMLDALKKLVEG